MPVSDADMPEDADMLEARQNVLSPSALKRDANRSASA